MSGWNSQWDKSVTEQWTPSKLQPCVANGGSCFSSHYLSSSHQVLLHQNGHNGPPGSQNESPIPAEARSKPSFPPAPIWFGNGGYHPEENPKWERWKIWSKPTSSLHPWKLSCGLVLGWALVALLFNQWLWLLCC